VRVLLNGINAFSAGGANVVGNIIQNISKIAPDIFFDVILPKNKGFENIRPRENMCMHFIPRDSFHTLNRFFDIHFNIEKWCKYYKSELCFTLGDIGPLKLKIPHIVLLQQAMILYRNGTYEKFWSLKERLKFYYTRRYFGKMSKNIDIITVQSPIMAERLQKIYNVPNNKIRVIPSTLPGDYNVTITNKPNAQMQKSSKPFRLLFLSAGYPHKNHAILPRVGMELQKRGLNNKVHIFLTLNVANKYTKKVLKTIEPYSSFISNLGQLKKDEVPRAYKAAGALFMPTLVESFGLIYLEAMHYKCHILTSDRDFSRWICGEFAMYFDPLDSISIVDTIEKYIENPPLPKYGDNVTQRLNHFPKSWEKVTEKYAKVIKEFI